MEKDEKLTSDQLDVIKKLSDIKAPIYLVGGWACELLLLEDEGKFSGYPTDFHGDIDFIVPKESLVDLQAKLSELEYKVNAEETGNPTLKYVSTDNRIKIDFGIINTDPSTGELYILVNLGDRKIKAYFNSEMVNPQPIYVDEVPMKTLSPRGLIQSFLINRLVGLPLREKDRIRAEKICAKYFPEESLESELFIMRVEEAGLSM